MELEARCRHTARLIGQGGSGRTLTSQPPCGLRWVRPDACDGVHIHPVVAPRERFAEAVRAPFKERHKAINFDVIEGPEYGADAAGIRRDFPDLPLVVRLHTPSCMIDEINASFVSASSKARYLLGGLRRGRLPAPYWNTPRKDDDPERLHTLDAERIVAPSQAILDELVRRWGLSRELADVVPNIFTPSSELLNLVPAPHSRTVLFLGKREVRKGVLDLAQAVPLVARAFPNVNFMFVGRDMPMPGSQDSVGARMKKHYGRWSENVTHLDAVDYPEVPALLERAAIAVFPSVWENFPFVCLEAMAAARAVVASDAGGMAGMIEHGRTGLLIPPRNPQAIADAITALLRDPAKSAAMGLAARDHVLKAYSSSTIGPNQEASYTAAIEQSVSNARRRILAR